MNGDVIINEFIHILIYSRDFQDSNETLNQIIELNQFMYDLNYQLYQKTGERIEALVQKEPESIQTNVFYKKLRDIEFITDAKSLKQDQYK